MKIPIVWILVVKMLQLVTGMSGVTQFNTLQCLPNFAVVDAASNLTAFQFEINTFSSVQTLSPSYILNCSGYVIAWGTFVGGVGVIEIEFQAWREGKPNEYWKVGGNRFEYELTGVDIEMAIFEVQDEESMFHVEEGDIIGIYMGGEQGNVSVQYIINPNATMYVLFDATEPKSSIFIDDRFTGDVLGIVPPIGMIVEQRTDTGDTNAHDQSTVASHSPSRVITSTPMPSIVVTTNTTLPPEIIVAIVTAVIAVTIILCLFALLLCNRLRKFKGKKGGSGGKKDSSVYEAVYSVPSNSEEVTLKHNPSYSSANVLNASTTSIDNMGLSNPIELQDNMSYSSLVDSIDSASRNQRLYESHIYSQPAVNSAHSDGIPRSSSLQYYSSADDDQMGCGEDEPDQIRIQDNLSYSATLTRGLESSCVRGNDPLEDDCLSLHEYAEPDFDGDDELVQHESSSVDGYLEIQ